MVSLATAYWMGLNAAENARLDRQMWDLATRATKRQQVPVDDRAALIDQVAQLQAQLQQVIAERDNALRQCNVNHQAWAAEKDVRQKAETALDATLDLVKRATPFNWDIPDNWDDPP